MRRILLPFLFFGILLPAAAQEKATIYGGMQIWGRYTDLNPGSTIGQNEHPSALDFSIRRYRIGVKGQPYDYLSYNIQLGNNNLSRFQKDQPPKLLDAYITWHINENTKITTGKHAWIGLSRYAAPSTFSNISSDINYSATTTLNVHDDFFRRLALAFHGQKGKMDYRLVIAKPFSNTLSSKVTAQASYVNEPTAFIYSGYVKYQFFDHESLSSAFSPWSYLGSKKILSFGAGFYHQEKGTQYLEQADTVVHAMTSFAVDAFLDLPVNNRIFTAYLGLLYHNLGPDFIRMVGANNPADGLAGLATLNGKGNSFPVTGSGMIVFSQFAVGFKQDNGHIIQPNASLQISDLEYVSEPIVLIDAGVSYYLDQQKSKLTFSAQRRPVLKASTDGAVAGSARYMLIGEYQIRF